MKWNAHPDRPAEKDYDRFTRVGKWIRRARLDELPQLYNILRGDMYFVGPRPFVPNQEWELVEKIPFYRQRWSVKPGATGWAQINRGYCATLEDNAEKLAYDRVGYGTTAFNAFTIGVQNGVVTLGGVAYGPTDKDSALSLVANYPGVKDVVDNIEVAPVSPMDDRIRLAEARAIYGSVQLNKYAIDPAKPIRITVVNGNVTLSGVVDSEADKEVANIRANGVPGVFKVINNLQVEGASQEK